MTAADKLRELLASRPAMPNTEELVRWWRQGGELVREMVVDFVALRDARDGAFAALRREQDARAGLRVELDRERAQHKANIEGFESALVQERYEKDILEQVEAELRAKVTAAESERDEYHMMLRDILATCVEVGELPETRACIGPDAPTVAVRKIADMLIEARAELERAKAELAAGTRVIAHPLSWTECPDCRALSKAGAEPPRCGLWLAMEASRA